MLAPENRALLKKIGRVVYLRASGKDLYERTRLDKNRPLLQAANPEKRIKTLLTERKPLYEEVADFIIDTGRQPVYQIVNKISHSLRLPSVAGQQRHG